MEVTKRSGDLESYDVEKIHQVVEWATEGINGVSSSDIEMNMNLSVRDKITTDEIHQILIKSASDLISELDSFSDIILSFCKSDNTL